MSKKKKESTIVSDKKLSDMKKKYGEILRSGEDVANKAKKRIYIPLSPVHDANIGRGIKEGSFLGLSGPAGSGKTSTALQLVRNAQREEFGKRKTFWDDVECRLDLRNLEGIDGLDYSEEIFYHLSPEQSVMSGEDHLSIIEDVIRTNENMVIVIDSISTLISGNELEGEISGQNRALMPKVLKNFIRRNTVPVQNRGHIIVTIMHIMADLSMSRKTKMMDGGNGIQFQCDNVIEAKFSQDWMEDGKKIGQFVNWELVKSSGTGITGSKYVSALRYGYGIDDIYELVDAAMELGIITKGGAWFSSDLWEDKIQGQAKLTSYLKENPEIVEKIKKELTELS